MRHERHLLVMRAFLRRWPRVGVAVWGVSTACTSVRPVAPATGALPPIEAPMAALPGPILPTGRDALVQALDSLLNAPGFANAHWGVLVVHPETGDTLYSRNASKLFVPASNQKLVTGAVALAQLGAEYRVRTPVLARGRVEGGVLKGDLVLVGRGDPSWSDAMQGDAMAPFRDLADSVAARGIRRVSGRLVAATGHFRGPRMGFGWAWDDLEYAYAAAVDALLFNEGLARVVVKGGTRAGAPTTVRVLPQGSAVPVRLDAATSVAGGGVVQAQIEWDDDARAYVVRGSVAPGEELAFRVAIREPARAALAAWREALVARGIVVDGQSIVDTTAAGVGPGDSVAVLQSPPLADILRYFEKPSQNQLGEMLLRVMSLEATGIGSADSGVAVVTRRLRQWGVDSTLAIVHDGSGLSRHDFVSPLALVRVLDAARRLPSFLVFRDALPVAGVDGTLASRLKNTPAQGNIRAKTGYVDRVRALSGYATTANGETLLFVALCNNWTTSVRDVERVQDELAVRLAQMRYRPLERNDPHPR